MVLSCRGYRLVPCLSVMALCVTGIGGYNVWRQVGRLGQDRVTLIRPVQQAIVITGVIIIIVIIVWIYRIG